MKKTEKNNNKSGQKHVTILGINVISRTKKRVLSAVSEKISHNYKFYIVTPNPELVLMAQADITLKKALNSTDLSVSDGTGLVMATKFINLSAPKNILLRFFVAFFQGLYVGMSTASETIKGRELFLGLMKLADENSWKVFFLGGENGEAAIAAKKLSQKYKKVRIKTEQGPMFGSDGEPATEVDIKIYKDIVKRINSFGPQLLILGLSDPKEEKFVYKNYNKLNIGGAAAFGGTFRYIAGLSKLPPKWMEKAGLEWLWRLITEPHRIGRVLNAFPIFPLRVFWYKVTGR